MRGLKPLGHWWNLVVVTKLMHAGAWISTTIGGLGLPHSCFEGKSRTYKVWVLSLLTFLLSFCCCFSLILLFSNSLFSDFPICCLFLVIFLLLPFEKEEQYSPHVCSTWTRFCFCFQCLWNGNSERINVLSKFTQHPIHRRTETQLPSPSVSWFVLFLVTTHFSRYTELMTYDFHYAISNMTAIFFLQYLYKLQKF